jgi:hypothetical protein
MKTAQTKMVLVFVKGVIKLLFELFRIRRSELSAQNSRSILTKTPINHRVLPACSSSLTLFIPQILVQARSVVHCGMNNTSSQSNTGLQGVVICWNPRARRQTETSRAHDPRPLS